MERKTRVEWSLKGHLLVLYDRGIPTIAFFSKARPWVRPEVRGDHAN